MGMVNKVGQGPRAGQQLYQCPFPTYSYCPHLGIGWLLSFLMRSIPKYTPFSPLHRCLSPPLPPVCSSHPSVLLQACLPFTGPHGPAGPVGKETASVFQFLESLPKGRVITALAWKLDFHQLWKDQLIPDLEYQFLYQNAYGFIPWISLKWRSQ